MGAFTASNPGNVRVDLKHFWKCNPMDLYFLGGLCLIAGALFFAHWGAGLTALVVGLAFIVSQIREAQSVFLRGDLCPAMVVDAEKNLIAVSTDLSKGDRPHRVVKVFKQPLHRVAGGPFRLKSRLAFVALYAGVPREVNWRDFGGYVVNSGTTSKKAIQRALGTFTDEEWSILEAAAAKLKKPYEVGVVFKVKG